MWSNQEAVHIQRRAGVFVAGLGSILITFSATRPAYGQAEAAFSACKSALIQSVDIEQLDRSARLAWFRTITRENFEERKQKAGGSLTWGEVELGGDYDSFASNWQNLRQKEGYNESEELASARIRRFVPPEGYKAFSDCMKSAANLPTAYGVHVWISNEDDQGAIVNLIWRPTGNTKGKVVSQSLTGGSVPGQQPGQWLTPSVTFGPNQGTTVAVQRSGRKSVQGTVSISGISTSFYLAPVNPPSSYSIAVSITGKATIPRTSTYGTTVHVTHTQCKEVAYDRIDTICLPEGNRITGINSVSTRPIPGVPLPPRGCFQATNPRLSPASTANCSTLALSYKECSAYDWLGNAVVPIPGSFESCRRGVTGGGTPVDVDAATSYFETKDLEFRDQTTAATFGVRRFSFPTDQIPAGASALQFAYAVTITDIVTGRAVQLSREKPQQGMFRLVFPSGAPGTVEVVQQL